MDEAARRIARRFALSGLHGLDFVRDAGGIPHLIEINPRATQICHLALGAGHDLPSALLGQKPRPIATKKPLIALFPQAWSTGRLSPDASAAYLDVPLGRSCGGLHRGRLGLHPRQGAAGTGGACRRRRARILNGRAGRKRRAPPPAAALKSLRTAPGVNHSSAQSGVNRFKAPKEGS